MSDKTLFQRIIDREIPGDFVYEDELCVAIKDINPKAPVHLLVIPRKPLRDMTEAQPEDSALLGHLLLVAQGLAKQNACKDYRLQINNGEKAGQTVFHLHLHLLGWPS
jgi:histidine triad (HIT) family protein